MTTTEKSKKTVKTVDQFVLNFCASRQKTRQKRFHMIDLLLYVAKRLPEVAPESPGRALRDLRARGFVDYEAVNPSDSLYRVHRVKTQITRN